jgi:2'-5' RNA ligase
LSERKIRSFIAIEVDAADVQERILWFQKGLVDTNADLKLVKTENIHITLKFLGDITTSMKEKISEELKWIQFSPFEIEFRDVGVFPRLNRINVIWIGIKKGIPELVDLKNQIESRLTSIGFRQETQRFRPHLTIARVRSARNKNKLTTVILELQNSVFGSLLIDSIKFKKSILTPMGPLYSTLLEVKGIKK